MSLSFFLFFLKKIYDVEKRKDKNVINHFFRNSSSGDDVFTDVTEMCAGPTATS